MGNICIFVLYVYIHWLPSVVKSLLKIRLLGIKFEIKLQLLILKDITLKVFRKVLLIFVYFWVHSRLQAIYHIKIIHKSFNNFQWHCLCLCLLFWGKLRFVGYPGFLPNSECLYIYICHVKSPFSPYDFSIMVHYIHGERPQCMTSKCNKLYGFTIITHYSTT